MEKNMRLIDADVLIHLMDERDMDCGEPKNMFDRGYSQAVEDMKWEIEQIKGKEDEN